MANAGADRTVNEGDTVMLSGSGTDAEGASLTYAWGAPAGITLSSSMEQSPTFTAPTQFLTKSSVLEFTLTVNDGVNAFSAACLFQDWIPDAPPNARRVRPACYRLAWRQGPGHFSMP